VASSPQILLPLENRRPDRFEDFLAGTNLPVIDAIRELVGRPPVSGPDEPVGHIFLRGPEGSGKSHLLNSACNLAQELGCRAFYMSLCGVPDTAADGLAGLDEMDLVCLDDVDAIAGDDTWERAVFHCFNRLRENHRRLVLSSALPLPALRFGLPDLASRLAWGLQLSLEPLDDQGKAEVLRLKGKALGIDLPADVISYLMSRGSRNLSTLLGRLEAIRMAALKGKRRITVPLAREVLASE